MTYNYKKKYHEDAEFRAKKLAQQKVYMARIKQYNNLLHVAPPETLIEIVNQKKRYLKVKV